MNKQLDYTALGARIRSARKSNGITQEQLGEVCSLSAAHIGHIERGTRIPSLETVFRIAEALNVSIDSLVFDSVQPCEKMFTTIEAMLKNKEKQKQENFYNTVKILAEKIDDL